jgi:hypothetical protein
LNWDEYLEGFAQAFGSTNRAKIVMPLLFFLPVRSLRILGFVSQVSSNEMPLERSVPVAELERFDSASSNVCTLKQLLQTPPLLPPLPPLIMATIAWGHQNEWTWGLPIEIIITS